MKILENPKNKIREVHATARVVVQRYGHTKKFAKHIVAFAIKQDRNLTDKQLAEFVGTSEFGREIGYDHVPHYSVFSKVRKRADPKILEGVYTAMVYQKFRSKPLDMIVQDSTAFSSRSKDDRDARKGHRTPSRMEQMFLKPGEKTFIFGYKVHVIAEVKSEMPLMICVLPANENDKTPFHKMYEQLKSVYRMKLGAKYLADAQYSSSKIRTELRYDGIVPVIPLSGNGYRKTEHPKDPDYGKRWAIERIFSRLKEVFGLSKNRYVGIRKVTMHVYSCLIAYAMRYLI
jgi:Transposase DDE domain